MVDKQMLNIIINSFDFDLKMHLGKCGVCFDPHISDATIATTAASFGVGASGHAGSY